MRTFFLLRRKKSEGASTSRHFLKIGHKNVKNIHRTTTLDIVKNQATQAAQNDSNDKKEIKRK